MFFLQEIVCNLISSRIPCNNKPSIYGHKHVRPVALSPAHDKWAVCKYTAVTAWPHCLSQTGKFRGIPSCHSSSIVSFSICFRHWLHHTQTQSHGHTHTLRQTPTPHHYHLLYFLYSPHTHASYLAPFFKSLQESFPVCWPEPLVVLTEVGRCNSLSLPQINDVNDHHLIWWWFIS